MSGTSTVLGNEDNNYTSPQSYLANTIYGAGGNDTLNGLSANDYLSGDTGNDSLSGGSDNDTLLGGDGNDTLLGGGGNDYVLGDIGNDSLYGGTYGNETLMGGDGNDVLVSNGGPDAMYGGAGDDTFTGFSNDGQNHFVSSGSGNDVLRLNANYESAALSTTPGTASIGGVNYSYNASYVTPTGYKLYFGEFTGNLEFNNQTVTLNVVCFAAGTRIMTSTGERAIESLRAGDVVVTASGHGAPLKPVLWVGRREVDLETHPRAEAVAPILVLPGALGDGVPHRPLRVSPDHGLLVDGALVPARLLVDGEMIRQQPAQGRVTYFHIELEGHDILLAEGAMSESYIDLGNRAAFDNAGVAQMLHADFTPKHAGGMSRITEGPALDRARLFVARYRDAARQGQRAAG